VLGCNRQAQKAEPAVKISQRNKAYLKGMKRDGLCGVEIEFSEPATSPPFPFLSFFTPIFIPFFFFAKPV